MAHDRKRFLVQHIKKLQSFWPIVGVLGLRQVGKTTLLGQVSDRPILSLDDEHLRNEALASAKVFLAKNPSPICIDEIHKAPNLFDQMKLQIDKKRIPGQFLITGSVRFTSLAEVRESLTGRIGLAYLYPMTLAECKGGLEPPEKFDVIPCLPPRFSLQEFTKQMTNGGLPVPMYLRNNEFRHQYFQQWIQTLLLRDLKIFFKRKYDPEFAEAVLIEIGKWHAEGIAPTAKHLSIPMRKAGPYLEALRNLFVLRELQPHSAGVGQTAFYFGDSGLAHFFMNHQSSEAVNLSLAKHCLLNEILCYTQLQNQRHRFSYFQSAKSEPVDLVWNDQPIKIIAHNRVSQYTWEKRGLIGALKKLNAKKGILVAPVDKIENSKKDEIVLAPWTAWS